MNEPLGKASVEITASTAGLEAGVDRAKEKVGELPEAVEKSVKKVESSFSKLEKAGAKVQAVFSKIVMPIAIATAVAGLIGKFVELRRATERFRTEIGNIGRASADRLSKVQQDAAGLSDASRLMAETNRQAQAEIAAVIKATEDAIAKDGGFLKSLFTGFDAGEAQQEAEELAQTITNRTRQIQAIANRQAREETERAEQEHQDKIAKIREDTAAKSAEAIRRATEDIQIDLLPEGDQITARLERSIEDAVSGVEKAGILDDADVQAALDRYIAFLREKARLDQAALDERLEGEATAEIAKGREVARRNAEALEREMQAVIDRLNQSFGFGTSGVGGIAEAIERNTRAIYTNGGR